MRGAKTIAGLAPRPAAAAMRCTITHNACCARRQARQGSTQPGSHATRFKPRHPNPPSARPSRCPRSARPQSSPPRAAPRPRSPAAQPCVDVDSVVPPPVCTSELHPQALLSVARHGSRLYQRRRGSQAAPRCRQRRTSQAMATFSATSDMSAAAAAAAAWVHRLPACLQCQGAGGTGGRLGADGSWRPAAAVGRWQRVLQPGTLDRLQTVAESIDANIRALAGSQDAARAGSGAAAHAHCAWGTSAHRDAMCNSPGSQEQCRSEHVGRRLHAAAMSAG